MAGRLKIYHLIRMIHLYAAFMIAGFLAMYFITGFAMTHEGWFRNKPAEIVRKEYQLHLPSGISDGDVTRYLQHQFNLPGPSQPLNIGPDGAATVSMERPGWRFDVWITPHRDSVKITTTRESAFRTFTVFHRIHGYGHGVIYDIYALMMDLSGLALITFALSGFYMWLRLFHRKAWGIVLISISTLYSLIVIVILMRG